MTVPVKKTWVEWLVSVVLVVITVVLTNHFTAKRDFSTTLKTELDSKATFEYVNKQDDNLRDVIEQQSRLRNERIESMDHKIDILLSRTK